MLNETRTLTGVDELGYTIAMVERIAAFESDLETEMPWLVPRLEHDVGNVSVGG